MLQIGNEGMSTIPGFSQIQFEGFCRCTNKALSVELDKLIDSYVVLFIFVSMFSLYSCSKNSNKYMQCQPQSF
jgi:hypothetical protein